MALLIPIEEKYFETQNGDLISVCIVRHDGGTNTFVSSRGATAVATLIASGETAPTTTISGSTVTLANGTAGDVLVVGRHVGRGRAGR